MEQATQEPVVAVLAEEWTAIAELCAALGAGEWELPTECPGWTVRDVLSHLIGIERTLLGDPSPSPPAERAPHVRNDIGAVNEAWVAERRSLPGPAVLDEFREVTSCRLEQLLSLPPERYDEVGPSPVGQVPYREFMQVRVMDCWVHEQDIRVATGRPGHADGAAARIALDRISSAMPFVVGKRAGVPEGRSVRFALAGSPARRIDVVVRDGRAREEPVEQPDVVLDMDAEVFWRLGCGRVTGDAALGAALVGVQGDADLARQVVGAMAFMI